MIAHQHKHYLKVRFLGSQISWKDLRMTDKTRLVTLASQLRGRASFLRDRGEIKSPQLMEEASTTIETLTRELAEAKGQVEYWADGIPYRNLNLSIDTLRDELTRTKARLKAALRSQ